MLLVAAVFALVVLVTSLPLRTLLQQRADTAATAATVRHLTVENRDLAAEAAALSNPSTISSLAHSEFDYVEPGQRAYDVVPPTNGSSKTPGVGQEQLGAPVPVPGSKASAEAIGAGALPNAVTGAVGSGAAGPSGSGGRSSAGPGASGSGGFMSRVLHALEFWR